MKSRLSLKSQLFILILIQFLLGIGIQSYYSYNLGNLLTERLIEYSDNDRDKIVTAIESKLTTIRYIVETQVINQQYQNYLLEDDLLERVALDLQIGQNFTEICERNPDVYDIKLVTPRGDTLIERSADTYFVTRTMLADYRIETIRSATTTRFYYDPDLSQHGRKPVFFFYIAPVYSTTVYTGEPLGYLIISISMTDMEKQLKQNSLRDSTEIFISDEEGLIGAASDSSLVNTYRIPESHSDSYVSGAEFESLRWKLHMHTSFFGIKTDLSPIMSNGVIFSLVTTALIILISIIIFNSIAAPIQGLVSDLRAVGENKNTGVNSSSSNEIEQISREINKMLVKLERDNREILKKNKTILLAQVEKKRAQLNALQSQINPHFLYNTLETIRMMSLSEERKDVAHSIRVLANLFRYSTKTGKIEVTIGEEVAHVENYCELMKLRFEDRIEILYDWDMRFSDHLVLKFLLQPLVENAFIHGLGKSSGVIRIELKQTGDSIVFSVADNGVGMDGETLNRIKVVLASPDGPGNQSIGMINVHKRVRLHYGSDYGINIESEEGEGTVVSIRVPYGEEV